MLYDDPFSTFQANPVVFFMKFSIQGCKKNKHQMTENGFYSPEKMNQLSTYVKIESFPHHQVSTLCQLYVAT